MSKTDARIRITRVASPDELGTDLEQPVRNLTAAVAGRMRRLVPKRDWRLHDSIEDHGVTSRNGAKVTGTVGFGGKVIRGRLVNYGLWVERGTSRMRAQPFARPALLQSRAADLVRRMP